MKSLHYVIIGAASGAALVLLATSPSVEPLISRATASPSADAATTYHELALFGEVLQAVRQDYVDKPDPDKLIKSALDGMVDGLDPHSNYMDAKSFGEMQVETTGEFGGLGMEVTTEANVVKVVSPIDGTPAAKAGILAGDIILQIDGKPIKDIPLDKVVSELRGPVGSKVTLNIQRKDTSKPIVVTLTREIIQVHPVTHTAEGGNVGYLRIKEFNELTNDELKSAITDLQAKIPADKMKGYILDLRNNPGGLLDQAVDVVNDFMSQGEIVSTRGRDADFGRAVLCQTQTGRLDQRQAAHRFDQRRLGVGIGNRLRRPAGSKARDHSWHAIVRQGVGSDHHTLGSRQWRAASDDRALLHALGPVDSG